MKKGESTLEGTIKKVVKEFLQATKDKEVHVVSHFDTDGITSAAIMVKALKNLDRRFSLRITKSLDREFIENLPEDKIILFLDLASGSLDYIDEKGLESVFIVDHHELVQKVPKNVKMVNPWLIDPDIKMSSAGLTYLFCKEMNKENKNLAKLAVIGMIGDLLESEIHKIDDEVLSQGDVSIRRGLLIYPSTRPINRTLEYSSNPYIPGVTGSQEGVIEMLRGAGIEPLNGKYKSLIELTEEEMKNLVTGIMLRNPKATKDITGDIFLIKFFNKLEDAREISARINACSRLGESNTALRLCMELPEAKLEAEEIHARYKQHIISGLNYVSKAEKIEGKGFVIINAKDNIKDTIVGTIASILSNSNTYKEGTIIVNMAYYDDKIKVSGRACGRNGSTRNVREILDAAMKEIGGEVGGHEFAAGCIVERKNESAFIDSLKKILEIELVKI